MYPWPLVKRVKRCWDGLKNWLSANFPEADATLRRGATEVDIENLENNLKVKLPLPTRLLYRFFDGQESTGGVGGTTLGSSLGIIGGYSFYDHFVNVYLLPLHQVILETKEIRDHLRFPATSKYVIVAASSTYIGKFFFLNCTTGQLCVGTRNLVLNGEMIPCVPNALINPMHDLNNGQQQDAMLLWLEEHVRRLQNGIIKLRMDGMTRSINLFPEVPPFCSTAVTNGVQVLTYQLFFLQVLFFLSSFLGLECGSMLHENTIFSISLSGVLTCPIFFLFVILSSFLGLGCGIMFPWKCHLRSLSLSGTLLFNIVSLSFLGLGCGVMFPHKCNLLSLSLSLSLSLLTCPILLLFRFFFHAWGVGVGFMKMLLSLSLHIYLFICLGNSTCNHTIKRESHAKLGERA